MLSCLHVVFDSPYKYFTLIHYDLLHQETPLVLMVFNLSSKLAC